MATTRATTTSILTEICETRGTQEEYKGYQ